MTEGLPKRQRLYKEKTVQALFAKGKGFSVYPFRIIALQTKPLEDEVAETRFLVSVSKKKFHHAIKRNRVKRLVREAWRRNKQELDSLCKANDTTLNVAFVYTATVILNYFEIERKIKQIVARLKQNEFCCKKTP